jgi:hypothetical protein
MREEVDSFSIITFYFNFLGSKCIQCNLEHELQNWELKYKSAQAESKLNIKALMTEVTTPY